MSDCRIRVVPRVFAAMVALLLLLLTPACSTVMVEREQGVPTPLPKKALLQTSPTGPATESIASAAEVPLPTTKVIVYYPLDSGAKAVDGSCFTNSLAVPSRDAWRCSVTGAGGGINLGNQANAAEQILDPCFDVGNGRVVCNPNPLTGQPGVLVKLTEPLPAPNLIVEKPSNPWLLELDDGSICTLATGATGVVDGKRINYLCSVPGSRTTERTAVLGEPRPGTIWMAEKAVVATRNGKLVATSSSTVPLRSVVKGPPQRVLFESGATSASFQRTVQGGDSHDFVLWAFAGQAMIVDVAAPKEEVSLSIVGRSTGDELAPGEKAKRWQVKLPETQDYRIRVTATGGTAEYQLVVTIPATLKLPTWGSPATTKGRVKPGQKVLYLLPGVAEQRVAISVSSPEGRVLLSMYGLGDGASLIPAVARTRSWEGVLPREQGYLIEVASEGASSDYTLRVAAR